MTLHVVPAPAGSPPFPVEAVVAEEDTFLVLSAEPVVCEPTEHPLRILQAANETEPVPPGRVVVRPGIPLRLLAVVHDLASEPTCRQEWVAAAYQGVVAEADRFCISSLGLPLLGTVHGRLAASVSVRLLADVLSREMPQALHHLWLIDAAAGFDLRLT